MTTTIIIAPCLLVGWATTLFELAGTAQQRDDMMDLYWQADREVQELRAELEHSRSTTTRMMMRLEGRKP